MNVNFSPIDDDLVEISKSLLLGKRGDDISSIKFAFSRLSYTLKQYDIQKKFGEREAPIFLLDHMLNETTPNKPTYFAILGLQKKDKEWFHKKKNAMKFDTKKGLKPGSLTDPQDKYRLSIDFAIQHNLIKKTPKKKHSAKKDATMIPGRSQFYRLMNDRDSNSNEKKTFKSKTRK